jgi:hypothetical protein
MARKPSVADWIATATPHQPTKCTVCKQPKLAAAIAQFHAARKSERTAVSWAQFLRDFLLPNGFQIRYDTMQHHVRKCIEEKPR